jgi:uncharacterized membrane protein YeaQ/YmgE (transglycosylase-associated protein family)
MTFVSWILVGVAAGLIVSMLFDSNMIVNLVLGVVVSVLGGGLTAIFTRGSESIWQSLTTFEWNSFWVSVASAIAILAIAQPLELRSGRQSLQH